MKRSERIVNRDSLRRLGYVIASLCSFGCWYFVASFIFKKGQFMSGVLGILFNLVVVRWLLTTPFIVLGSIFLFIAIKYHKPQL